VGRCIIPIPEPVIGNAIVPSRNVSRRVSAGGKTAGFRNLQTGTTSRAPNRWIGFVAGGRIIRATEKKSSFPKNRYKTTAKPKALKINRITPI
jgi:hypothetical protein